MIQGSVQVSEIEEPEWIQHYFLLIRKHIDKISDPLLGKTSTLHLMETLTRLVVTLGFFRQTHPSSNGSISMQEILLG